MKGTVKLLVLKEGFEKLKKLKVFFLFCVYGLKIILSKLPFLSIANQQVQSYDLNIHMS